LTPKQLNNLLKAIHDSPDRMAADIMLMALYTGMRRGEICKLKHEDIDFRRGFITIRDPKGKSDQIVPLNEAAKTVLLAQGKTKSPYIFPWKDEQHMFAINKRVKKIKENAGLPDDFRPLHGLRHVYASMLASSGKVDMYTLQKLLTHKDPRMTQRYAHLRDDVLKRASKLAGELIYQAVTEARDDEKRSGDGKK
jgi:integrase